MQSNSGTPAETVVYEDAPYAIRTAKDAGYRVAAIYDEGVSEARWAEMSALADYRLEHWSQALNLIL